MLVWPDWIAFRKVCVVRIGAVVSSDSFVIYEKDKSM